MQKLFFDNFSFIRRLTKIILLQIRYTNPNAAELNETMHSHTTAQSGRRRDPDDDDESSDESSGGSSYLSSIEKMKKNNYGHFLEMKFMRAVHDNDYFMVESMLWKQK